MEKEWFVYKIFVSSTFKDMDQERDVIKFNVLSRLNEHYRDHRIQFQVVDLRIGINTENMDESQSESFVLDSCFQNIDSARPFFIGLLGERYGWIPSSKRWEAIMNRLDKEKRCLLEGGNEKSVTELEILYGAIGDHGKYINHSLFFFRDRASYLNVPVSFLSQYIDCNEDSHTKCEILKKNILDVAECCKKNNNCVEYHLSWNQTEGLFEGLDVFADLLFEKLCHEIDTELRECIPPQTWIEQECLNKDYLHMNNCLNKTHTSQYSYIISMLEEGKQVILTGKQGSGKTVLLSQVYKELTKKDSWICLSSFVGISPYSKTMYSIVKGWIVELGGGLTQDDIDEMHLKNLFISCIDNAIKKGNKICLFIDSIENFMPISSTDIFLLWMPNNVSMLVSVAEQYVSKVMRYHSSSLLVNMAPLQNSEEKAIINQYEKYYNISLPEDFCEWLSNNTSQPIYIQLLITIFANLGLKDFQTIRRQDDGREIDRINHFIMDILKRAPLYDAGLMLKFSVSMVAENMGCAAILMQSLGYIACSGGGLRENDLNNLIGEEWDSLRFHSLMSIFCDYFYCERDCQRWHFRNPAYAKAFITDNKAERQRLSKDIVRVLFSYDDDEKQKQDLLFYHLLKSGQSELSRGIMTEIESEYRIIHGGWYRISMFYILSEDNLREQIYDICSSYSSEERVGFVYYFKYFLPIYCHADIVSQCVDDNLNDIDYHDLNIVNGYRLAGLYGDLFQTSKYTNLLNSGISKTQSVYYLERSIEGYSYCVSLQPDYLDSRNMLCCMMSEMLPIFAERNDFTSIENYISIINKENFN